MAAGMTGAQLAAWSRRARRREPRRGLMLAALLGTVGATAWIARAADASAASDAWLTVTVVVLLGLALAIPQGMFWRRDAALLARLPIDGRALLGASLRRTAEVAGGVAVVVAVLAAPLARWSTVAALRHAAVGVGLVVLAAALVAAVATAAAALVGAALAQAARLTAMARTLATDARGPATSWLGILPGLATAAVVLLALALRPFVQRGGPTMLGPGALVLAIAVGGALLALLAARAVAPGMAVALREVAALDRVRLAHLEIHPPSRIEAALARLVGGRAAIVLTKDARLMRRRYPMAWIVGVGVWFAGGVGGLATSAEPVTWAVAAGALAGGYLALLGGRLATAPIEERRQLALLPVALAAAARGKRAWLLGWTITFVVPGLALAARGSLLGAGLGVGLALVGALVGAARAGQLGYHPAHG